MSTLVLVRHALPAADKDAPPADWSLSPEGERAAAQLVDHLPGLATLVSSPEAKAAATLAPAARFREDPVVQDGRFREVDRPEEPWGEDVRRTRRAYLDGHLEEGWEPHSDVARRFGAGVEWWSRLSGDRPLVVASHGMAMTVWLVGTGALARDQAGDFWERMRFPELLRLTRTPQGWRRA